MWARELFGTDVYHLVAAFVVYSVMGWLVESIYMSLCNRRITNRGFAKGPFCPIYGFGAVVGYLILSPLKGQYVKLYIVSAVTATAFEYLVGLGMIKIFGRLWWDYHNKPFNFRGILCLESTIAWGFYGIGIVQFVNDMVYRMIDSIDVLQGIRIIRVVLILVAIDYTVQLLKAFHVDVKEKKNQIVDRCQAFMARW